jgi:hypothetical protein
VRRLRLGGIWFAAIVGGTLLTVLLQREVGLPIGLALSRNVSHVGAGWAEQVVTLIALSAGFAAVAAVPAAIVLAALLGRTPHAARTAAAWVGVAFGMAILSGVFYLWRPLQPAIHPGSFPPRSAYLPMFLLESLTVAAGKSAVQAWLIRDRLRRPVLWVAAALLFATVTAVVYPEWIVSSVVAGAALYAAGPLLSAATLALLWRFPSEPEAAEPPPLEPVGVPQFSL